MRSVLLRGQDQGLFVLAGRAAPRRPVASPLPFTSSGPALARSFNLNKNLWRHWGRRKEGRKEGDGGGRGLRRGKPFLSLKRATDHSGSEVRSSAADTTLRAGKDGSRMASNSSGGNYRRMESGLGPLPRGVIFRNVERSKLGFPHH